MKSLLKLLDYLLAGKRTTRRPARTAPRRWAPVLEHLEDRLQPSVSSIASNFNGTAIPAGSSVWFNSVLKVTGLGNQPVTLSIDHAAIDFTANGTSYHEDVPNASITFSPSATSATTTFNAGANTWVTTVPLKMGGSTFLAGLALPLPNGLPGGINPVTWQADFHTDRSGVGVNWQWAAAVYTNFSTNYAAVGVKPVDDNHASSYQNHDNAGTPEAFKSSVVGGAMGGGGSNWTGGYSATKHVTPDVVLATASLSGTVTDGTLTPSTPLAGVTVTLTGMTSTGTPVSLSTPTGANGFYSFTGLLPGTYTITEAPPSGYVNGSATAGTQGGQVDSSFSSIGTIVLTTGATGVNYNFVDISGLPNS
jgi:hypothetical protein